MSRPTQTGPRHAARPGRMSWSAPVRLVMAAIALALVAFAAAPVSAAVASTPATHIVQLRPGVGVEEGAQAVRAAGGSPGLRLPLIGALGARLDARAAVRLAHDPRVRAVSANGAVAPQSNGRLAASRLASAYPWSVLAPQAWGRTTGRGVTVAVIDTGIAGDLADFRGDDGSSRVVGSAVVNPAARGAGDDFGHGTHVAGIIAGDGTRRDDRLAGRYVGIAPDADLVSIKIDDDQGRATVLDAIYGLQFAVDHKDEYGIRVVNLSLESSVAGSYRTDPLDAAVEAAWMHGIVVVAAAGNRGRDADAVHYAPGNDPFAITVGAVDDRGTRGIGDDQVAKWSSQGTTQDGFAKPELTAPGSQIVSTIAPGSAYVTQCPSCNVDGGYFRAGGTSMSAPVVAGVVALVLQAHPDWTPDQVKWALVHSTRLLKSRLGEVNAAAVLAPPSWRIPSANAGIAPSTLLDPATGDIDYSRSSWTRSSWTGAADALTANWSRSSWTCLTCEAPDADQGEASPVGSGIQTGGGKVKTSRSSWTRSSWTAAWGL
jgi:serine protease AprX